MSTRTQVQVKSGAEKITLYHHTDGYPEYMLPLIQKAWREYGTGWEGARVGKVASMLCAVDPVVFEPEAGQALHGDIEYYYVIDCKDTAHVGTTPDWTVTSYSVNFDFEGKLSRKKRLNEMGKIKVSKIDEKYINNLQPSLEDNAY